MKLLSMWRHESEDSPAPSCPATLLRAGLLSCAAAALLLLPALPAVAGASPGVAALVGFCSGLPDGTPCDDGNCCTGSDACAGGLCHGTPYPCDDANPCTYEYCDPYNCVGCYYWPIPGCVPCFGLPPGAPCDDQDPCTTGDTCVGGICAGTPSVPVPWDIRTAAGTGAPGYSGDGALATLAMLNHPKGVAVDSSGNLYIADGWNDRVRRVDTSGVITLVAGDGTAGYAGDNGPAKLARLNFPTGVAVDSSGNIYIADYYNHRVRRVSAGGTITTVAGSGESGYGGDEGAATLAKLANPAGVALDAAGNLYIAERTNNRVRRVDLGGTITTVAGNGGYGYSGDHVRATSASLSHPHGVALDLAGNLYIADRDSNRIRKVDLGGTITTVAGNGTLGGGGDNGPATAAGLYYPMGVAADRLGSLYIADSFNNRIRKVDLGGTITTVAGTGAGGYSGDDGPAASARLALPFGVAVDRSLNLFIGDDSNHRVREVARPVLCAQQPAGSPCDDGDPCTDNDTCASSCGRCAGGVVVPDSTNPCVFAACDRLTGTTVQWPMPDGTPCDDGNPCSDPDRCLEGVCVGTILSGDDGNSCTEDLCDVVLGIVHRPLPDGSWCTDGNPCTIDDACLNVVCVGTPTTGSSCDDGNCCTVGDVCSAGACAGTLMSCDDANPCTEDFCLPTICVCAYVLRPDGAACDDGNPCSIGEACIGGVCQGIPKCVDGRTCTDDLCDPQTGGCLYPVNCPPGQGCDAGGACAPGLCWDAVTRCNDLDACTEDTCNPINGKCGHTPICATDVGMASLTVPATVKAGRMANISLQERNYGTRDATGSVTLYRDGSAVKVWTDVVFAAGRSRTQSYGFNTSGYGGRTIQWYAVVTVPGDLNPYNNTSAVRTMVVTP